MAKYNIFFIDDEREDRKKFVRFLNQEYGHNIKGFRDIATFNNNKPDEVSGEFDQKLETLMILDIMLAEELDKTQLCAPYKDNPGPLEKKTYIDSELGLRFAKHSIRVGKLKRIDKEIPILFLTARQNLDIVNEIKRIPNTAYLDKPVFLDDIQDAITKLMRK